MMKTSFLLFTLALTSISACSYHETYHDINEATAITASDIQKAHQEANTTLDQIADKMASGINKPNTSSQPAYAASIPLLQP
jgi:hypothetical protein